MLHESKFVRYARQAVEEHPEAFEALLIFEKTGKLPTRKKFEELGRKLKKEKRDTSNC